MVRQFETGATRSDDSVRDDPEGYWSPLSIDRYNEYMTKHRLQPDGGIRDSDNWQKGFPLATCFKGMWRHFLHAWTRHRGWPVRDPGAAENLEEDLCAIIFNAQVALHQIIKERLKNEQATSQANTHRKRPDPPNGRVSGALWELLRLYRNFRTRGRNRMGVPLQKRVETSPVLRYTGSIRSFQTGGGSSMDAKDGPSQVKSLNH